MKIYIGADHNGFALKGSLITSLQREGYEVAEAGGAKLDPEDDFPIFAQKVVREVLNSNDPEARGILICGSGQGMCMAANRFKGIRAAFGYDLESVHAARNDSDSNVLCLPANVLKGDSANKVVEAWLKTPFAGAARFVRRIKEMDEMN